MKLKIVVAYILLFLSFRGMAQDFGCFNGPNTIIGGYVKEKIKLNSKEEDSIFWSSYNLKNQMDGYYIEKWNKYQVKMEGQVLNGMKEGIWKIYNHFDPTFSKVKYHQNLKDGLAEVYRYYSTDTFLIESGTFRNNLREGEYINYDGHSNIVSRRLYHKGNLSGKYIEYFKNGQIKFLKFYTINKNGNSIEDSMRKDYYPTGILKDSVLFNWLKEAKTTFLFDKVGKLKRIEVVSDDGSVFNVFDGDTVNRMDNLGRYQRKWIYFSEASGYEDSICNDVPKRIEYYYNDIPVGTWEGMPKKSFYKTSRVKEKYIWKDTTEEAAYFSYNKNGVLMEEGGIIGKNLLKFGLWKEYYENGNLKSSGNYYLDRPVGNWIYYKSNGRKANEINFKESFTTQ